MRKTHLARMLSASILLVSCSLLPTATLPTISNSQRRAEGLSSLAQEPDRGQGRRAAVDAVVESYIRFLGGRAAIKRHVSVVEKGYFYIVAGRADLTIYQKRPNKSIEVIYFPNGEKNIVAVDGAVAWNVNHEGKFHKAVGEELRYAIREANFTESLYQLYPQLSLTGQETVEGRKANVLEANLNDGYRRRMYFATENGELLRIDREGPDGTSNWFFYDYRDIDGVKYPFVRREESPIGIVTLHMDEIKTNVAIKDSFFSMPAAVQSDQMGGVPR